MLLDETLAIHAWRHCCEERLHTGIRSDACLEGKSLILQLLHNVVLNELLDCGFWYHGQMVPLLAWEVHESAVL